MTHRFQVLLRVYERKGPYRPRVVERHASFRSYHPLKVSRICRPPIFAEAFVGQHSDDRVSGYGLESGSLEDVEHEWHFIHFTHFNQSTDWLDCHLLREPQI